MTPEKINEIALNVLTTGRAYRVAWSDDGDGESGPTGGVNTEVRLGRVRLMCTSTSAYLTTSHEDDVWHAPLMWARITDVDVTRILRSMRHDERIPVVAAFHDGELVHPRG